MIIRCNKCYKVLHSQEVYCTRCGEQSQLVIDYMKNPSNQYLTEYSHMKIGLSLYFFICFMLNGLISVMLGVYYYQVIDQTIEFGTIGSNIPIEVLSFSQTYALLIIGIAASIVYSLYNRKGIMQDIKVSMHVIKSNTSLMFKSILIFTIGSVGIYGLAQLVQMQAIIPSSFLLYLSEGRVSILQAGIILILFAFIEELVFRKMIIEGLDERYLFGDISTFIIMSLLYAVYHFLVFFDFAMILPTLLFGSLMGLVYRTSKDSFFIGFILRSMFIIVFLVIIF
jgi:membrane protease YdiL (CAAX protease family)